MTALTQLRKCQMQESADAGTAYQAGLDALDWCQGGEYVITDQLGTPVHPEWYSDEFGRLLGPATAWERPPAALRHPLRQ